MFPYPMTSKANWQLISIPLGLYVCILIFIDDSARYENMQKIVEK